MVVDDLRRKWLLRNPVVKTPNLDRLAERGMVFNHAYCPQAFPAIAQRHPDGRRPDATKVWDLETHFRRQPCPMW